MRNGGAYARCLRQVTMFPVYFSQCMTKVNNLMSLLSLNLVGWEVLRVLIRIILY